MKIAERSTLIVLVIGAVAFVGATIWNRFPSDGANIGAGLVALTGIVTVGVGLVMGLGVIVWKLTRRRWS